MEAVDFCSIAIPSNVPKDAVTRDGAGGHSQKEKCSRVVICLQGALTLCVLSGLLRRLSVS